MVEAPTEADLRRRVLRTLAELVPADVLTWDRVELTTGAVGHEAVPAGAEPRGAFDAVVETSADHPLLAAHAARRRPALRLWEVVEAGPLTRSELYDHLLHAAGVEYEIAIGMHTGRGEAVVLGLGRTERQFSERDRDVLDVACPVLEGALRTTQARGRLAHAPAARQRPRRAAPHRLAAPRRPARTAARGARRQLPHRRARPPRPDATRDRGAARRRHPRGRGRDRLGPVPQPPCRSSAARTTGSQARRAHRLRRRRPGAPREHLVGLRP